MVSRTGQTLEAETMVEEENKPVTERQSRSTDVGRPLGLYEFVSKRGEAEGEVR